MIDPELGQDALCTQTDPELFFPERGQSNTVAKSICASCPISLACLEDALTLEPEYDYGIWGGTSSRERHILRNDPRALERMRDALRIQDAKNRAELNLAIIKTR